MHAKQRDGQTRVQSILHNETPGRKPTSNIKQNKVRRTVRKNNLPLNNNWCISIYH